MDGETGPGGSDLSGENFGDYGGGGGGGSGNYSSPGEADQAAANFNASLAGYGINESIPGLGVSETGPMHSPGLSYATLNVLNDIGLGKMDIPGFSQNIEQALAAQNVHNVLNYTVPALVSMVPGYGTVSALGKGIANIHALIEGRLTPAEVMPGLAAGLIGAKTGIPSGILEGLFEGNLGKAAGSGVQAGITSGLGPLGGLAFNLSGAGSAVNRGVSDAVSGATGGARSGGLGGLPGAGPAPSTSAAPTGNTYGDTGINPDTYAVTAAIEQAAQEFKQPTREREMVAGRYGPIMNYDFGA